MPCEDVGVSVERMRGCGPSVLPKEVQCNAVRCDAARSLQECPHQMAGGDELTGGGGVLGLSGI